MSPDPGQHTDILFHILDQAPIQLWGVDRDLNLTYLRGAVVEAALPRPLHEYVDGPLAAVLTPDSQWVLDRHRAAFRGEPQAYEVRWHDRVLWVHLAPPDQQRDEVSGLAVDATDRVRARDRLQHMFEGLGQGVVFQAPTGEITEANAAAEEILGLTVDQLAGRTSMDPEWEAVREDGTPFPGEEHPAMVALREKRVVPGVIMGVSNPRENHHRWIRVTAVPRFGPGGDPVEVLTSFEDITELKEAQEALEHSENLLLRTGEMARIGGWELFPESDHVHWTAVTRSIHGVAESYEPSLEDAFAFFPGEARGRIVEAVRGGIEDGQSYDMVLPFVTAQGDNLWVRTIGIPELEDGRCVRLYGLFQDVTEQKVRERELERLNRALSFVSASNAALVRSPQDREVAGEICRVAIDIGGYAHVWIGYRDGPEQPVRMFQADHTTAIDLFEFDSLRTEIEAAESVGLAFVTRGLDHGSEPWEQRLASEGYSTFAVLPFPAEANLEGFVAFAHGDANALTQEEVTILQELVADLAYGLRVEGLRDELLLIQKAVTSLSVGVSIHDATDPGAPRIFVNEGFTQITGYDAEEVLGRECGGLLQGPDTDPGKQAELTRAFAEGRSARVTVVNYRKSGEPFWNRITLEPVHNRLGDVTHFVAIQEDVTEQRRMESELEHRTRLSAIGELAGGVAHDFRNILTAARGLLDLSLSEVDLDQETQEHLVELEDLIARGTAVTERLLILSRRGGRDPEPVSLSRVLTSATTLMNHTLRDDIVLDVAPVPDEVVVSLDEQQFITVVLNLARNAQQAMPEGGTLTFQVDYPVLAGTVPWWPWDLGVDSGTSWVRLTARDTGVGMTAETLGRAFDPYFTTKPAGEGTGLGLSMVYGVVERLGGRVWIESEPGRGTDVHILLPVSDEEVPEVIAEPRAGRMNTPTENRTGTILLAEDDPTVLKVFRTGLERAGHTVLSGTDGREALNAFQADPDRFDLIITDGFMPRMSGAELGRAAWKLRPDLTVVVTSGFGSEDIRSEFPADPPGSLVFMPKPLSIRDLLEAVQEFLSTAKDR